MPIQVHISISKEHLEFSLSEIRWLYRSCRVPSLSRFLAKNKHGIENTFSTAAVSQAWGRPGEFRKGNLNWIVLLHLTVMIQPQSNRWTFLRKMAYSNWSFLFSWSLLNKTLCSEWPYRLGRACLISWLVPLVPLVCEGPFANATTKIK